MGSVAYMRPCYELTNGLTFQDDEERRLCRAIHRMVDHGGLIAAMVKRLGIHGVVKQNLAAVLKFVSSRTLDFSKPYEMITRREVAENCSVSIRTAQRAFDVLVRAGMLHKMCCHDDGNECYYSLNLGKIYAELRPEIDSLNPKTRAFFEMDELHRLVVGNKFTKMCEFVASFANTLIHGIKSFINKAREAYKAMTSDLLSMVTAAKAHSKAVSKKKSTKKAEGALFTPDGRPDTRAGLEHWYRCLEDFEYEGIVRDMTGKIRGLMGHFMKELRENHGLDDNEIREAITRIVGKWRWVPVFARGIQQTTKDGKTFRAFMPEVPDFAFLFTHRVAMIPLLRKVESMTIPGMRG